MKALFAAHEREAVNVHGGKVSTAIAQSCDRSLIAATNNGKIVAGDVCVSVNHAIHSLALVRYVTVAASALPSESLVIVALIENVGLQLFFMPELKPVSGEIAQALEETSKHAHLFSSDAIGSEFVSDVFRLALAIEDRVLLVSINVPQGDVVVQAETKLSERIVALAFADMSVVATTEKNHCMLRISRSGGMALAATVARKSKSRRARSGAPASADAGTAVMSFFGGLFNRKGPSSSSADYLAISLPDNRWILSIDQELVTYSSFGAKLDDMENAFKSSQAIDIPPGAISAALQSTGSTGPQNTSASNSIASSARPLRKNPSISSFASGTSAGTAVTAMTLMDEARATRAEKPPVIAVYSSPFILCITEKHEVVAFAANGSVPGVIASISLLPENEPSIEEGATIVPCRDGDCLALIYWPSGRLLEIRLTEDLEVLIQKRQDEGELRQALALVSVDQLDRTINLRRKLASMARAENWHDAAIHHMQHVINLSFSREGVSQLDLVAEAVELRGVKGSGWDSDVMTATLWADFLYRLRRRVMQPSAADVGILETLCRADEFATRINSVLSVKHQVSLDVGESIIASGDNALRDDECINALVSLYTSLGEFDQALVLLENSGMNRAFDEVCIYLSRSITASENPDIYFTHLQWVAKEAKSAERGEKELFRLLNNLIGTAKTAEKAIAERILQGIMFIVVEQCPHLLDTVINSISPPVNKKPTQECLEPSQESTGVLGDEARRNDRDLSHQDSTLEGSLLPNIVPSSGPKSPGPANDIRTLASPLKGSENPVSTDLLAVAILAGMSKADIMEDQNLFEKLREMLRTQVIHKEDADYHSESLLKSIKTARYQSMALHEELAFLLGRQGRHEAAANELAAERTLSTKDAAKRFASLLPSGDKASASQALVAAYLRVSSEGRASRVDAAAEMVRREGGRIDIAKVLRDVRDGCDSLSIAEMSAFLQSALIVGNERLRLAQILQALRSSEVRRMREEVLMRRRRCVIIGHDRACNICTRRIGERGFAAYPDGSVAHYVCHMSSQKR